MNEPLFFAEALAELYGQPSATFHELNAYGPQGEAPVYHMYRVELPTGESWVLSAYHDAFAQWPTFTWSSSQPLVTWLRLRTTLLSHLEQLHYPAPRVQPAHNGWSVVRYQQWNMLMTTYVEGQANVLTEEQTCLLGSALGRLHQLDPHPPQSLGLSWWNTTYSLPHAIERLNAASSTVPASYQGLYANMQQTLRMIGQQLRTLPEVIIHGDCWPPNGVDTGDARVVLIDWECAGRGAALLDLGAFLLTCQCDQRGDFPSVVDEARIAAAVDGYIQWRSPTPPEMDLLLEAIRFSICWRGAWLFARLAQEGWTLGVEPFFQRVQRAYLLAEPTAHLAQRSFVKNRGRGKRVFLS